MAEIQVGTVSHYFGHISVAAIELKDKLSVGDTIRFVGHTTDFQEKLGSMQIEHQNVSEAKAGDSIGIKVKERVRPHDKVFKIVEQGGETGL
jgi:translation elongation factor EF-1alpha